MSLKLITSRIDIQKLKENKLCWMDNTLISAIPPPHLIAPGVPPNHLPEAPPPSPVINPTCQSTYRHRACLVVGHVSPL